MYVSGMAGWELTPLMMVAFNAFDTTGDEPQLPIGFHVHENGIRVDFLKSLNRDVVCDPEEHFVQAWNYRYSGAMVHLSIQRGSWGAVTMCSR